MSNKQTPINRADYTSNCCNYTAHTVSVLNGWFYAQCQKCYQPCGVKRLTTPEDTPDG